ncbi:putative spo22-domain-containing protein [Phaeoacremonium minimum UCRPA7]|uniref:Putative spo22-domain-containing protein n=1 Tax=Phaeoacremonium minimum (strain UCR-PA7) TaxID=1286976 RepID=R8BWC5_PHAM7|nr:putative spo22-domain-containing protein [Phaeoacremonium minimum UCRPA7]EOO03635.1 putative spo22-domain-containing protein [Phaeoacremonium minimum UCRPA7]
MPPDPDAVHGGSAHTAKTKRAKAVISFAVSAVKRVNETVEEPVKATKLADELQHYIKLVETSPRIQGLYGNVDLDTQGTKLWNLCISPRQADAQRANEALHERRLLLLNARVFAFQILDLSRYTPSSGYAQVLLLLNMALRAGVACLSGNNVDLARIALQRAADYNGHLQNLSQSQRLTQDEAWKEDQFDVAEHMFIAQVLVTALLGVQTTDGYEKAQNLVRYLKSEIGDKLVVLLLDLEVLIKAPDEVFDADAYARILERMMQIFNHQETNFKLLVYHIRKLHEKSPSDGVRILDMFLLTLNGQQCDASWIENLVITRMWMITSHRDSDSGIDEAQKLLHKLDKPLGAEGTVAAQTLIWKKLEYNFTQHQFDLAEKWCRLALSPLFRNSGPHNIAKLERYSIDKTVTYIN